MNFLAHAYLSGTDPEIITGNFIGDFVKGNKLTNYSDEIQQGIRLHRDIDYYTDHHPVVLKSKKRLQSKYRHYAGVIVDMFYDHLFASSWSKWHHETLEKYTHHVYEILDNHAQELPERFNYMLSFMRRQNWLLSYSKVDGIHSALKGMAGRTKFDSGMETASLELENHYDDFKEEFQSFFPDVINFTSKFEFVSKHKDQ